MTIPADDMTHTIRIVDSDDPSCEASLTTTVLTSCSTDCEISISTPIETCFDNGTLDDPSDDFYEISFTASAINGASGYELTIDGVFEGNYNYGQLVELTLPADDSSPILGFTDLVDAQCILSQVIGPLESCSDLCTIEPMIMESMCFDNGTPIDPSDDYWEIVVFVNPANGVTSPMYDLRIDGVFEGTYSYSENITITIPADNDPHQILVSDSEDEECDAFVTTESLTTCSTPCEISLSYENVSCDNNSTNDTGDDDLYYFDLVVSNPVAGAYEIPALSLTGNFNESVNLGPFNISDGVLTLSVFDADQNLCFREIDVVPPAQCSNCVQVVDAGDGGVISCEITEVALEGTSSEAGAYSWFGPAGNLVSQDLQATAVSVGMYTFSVTFEDGCVAEDSVEIVADVDLPIAILTHDGDITCSKTTSILDGSPSGTEEDFFFYWFNEDGDLVSEDPIFETDEPGVYFLQVETKSNNCKSALEAVVVEEFINEPVAIIYFDPQTIIDCVVESVTLSSEQEENVNYSWSLNGVPVDVNGEFEISDIGLYGLVALDTITGCIGEGILEITSLVEYPNINLDAPNMLDCDNSQVVITASSPVTSLNLSSFWQDEDLNVILEDDFTLDVTEPGEYYFTLIDNDNGCENTDTITISLFENDIEVVTIPEITYVDGESVSLSATVNIEDSEIETIDWTPSENMNCPTCLTTLVTNPTDSLYEILVVDIYGCSDTAQVRLIKKDRPEIYIPNVLNVNSSAGNDLFTIYGNEEVESIQKIEIFDRWGNKVFAIENLELNNPAVGWDGTYNGQDVEQGVYVYIIEALFVDGSVEVYFGDITVLR